MFGWLKNRQEKEHIKLTYQNFLAYNFLSMQAKIDKQSDLLSELSARLEISRQLSIKFQETKSLSADEIKTALDFNRDARGIYDNFRNKRNELSKMFGSKQDLAPPFDDKFKPPLGWKVFIEDWKKG